MTPTILPPGLRPSHRWLLAPLLIVGLSFVLAACDTSSNVASSNENEEVVAPSPDANLAIASAAATSAGLSGDQSESVRSILTDLEREPGALWAASARIHDALGTEATVTLAESLRKTSIEARAKRRHEIRRRTDRRRGPRADRRSTADARLDRMRSLLNLTEDQQATIDSLRVAYRSEMRSLRGSIDGRPSPEARDQFRALRTKMRAEIKAVLTDEQRAQIQTRRETRQAKRTERRDAMQSARTDALGLTSEQQAAFDALRADVKAERKAGERPDRQALRDRAAEILTNEQEAITALRRALAGTMRTRAMQGRRHSNRFPHGRFHHGPGGSR